MIPFRPPKLSLEKEPLLWFYMCFRIYLLMQVSQIGRLGLNSILSFVISDRSPRKPDKFRVKEGVGVRDP